MQRRNQANRSGPSASHQPSRHVQAGRGPTLSTPVQYLKGVGPQRAAILERLGLRTAADLLFYFPRDYQDLTDQREVDQLEEGHIQSVRGEIEEIEQRLTRSGRHVLGLLVRSRRGYLRAVWFNQPFMAQKFHQGQRVMVSGKPRREGLFWEMFHPRVELLAEDEDEPLGKILPVYPLTEGLQQWHLRRIIRGLLENCLDQVEEAFPPEYLQSHQLWPLRRTLQEIHFPSDQESLRQARRRLVYQELFVLQLALAVKRRQQRDSCRAPMMPVDPQIDARIRRLFPFELTRGQQQVIDEITRDMAAQVPMSRLLQGDVGSGKTVVAVYAMLLCVAHGYQAALMAPTEVLARQHAQTLRRLLAHSRVRIGELRGGLPARERGEMLGRIAAGQVDLVVGTHAMIQEDVRFAKLGLVVIDEQHKFGVRQRARLRHAGLDPHYLVMTATPIPRTLTMTLFGDLDVSTLRDSPPGRQKVYTRLADQSQRAAWWEFFRKKLREGRQGYVVTPLVEDSEQLNVASLEAAFEALANGELEAFRLDLIHGRLSPEEKDAAMERFRRGETQVLVCTSVVEVGVDVPNATLMTIEGGERFGLAQLHQLRGRISRGRYPGYCCVFADPQTEEAHQRLKAFASTTDGFELAEVDFRLRGPGELLGTRQHGLPPFHIADLLRDREILEEARRDAQQVVAEDPGLARPEYARLRRQMLARYGRALDLGDVG